MNGHTWDSLSLPFPRPPRCVADVRDLNHVVTHSIKNFVGITDKEFYPHIGIVRFVSAVWLIT